MGGGGVPLPQHQPHPHPEPQPLKAFIKSRAIQLPCGTLEFTSQLLPQGDAGKQTKPEVLRFVTGSIEECID